MHCKSEMNTIKEGAIKKSDMSCSTSANTIIKAEDRTNIARYSNSYLRLLWKTIQHKWLYYGQRLHPDFQVILSRKLFLIFLRWPFKYLRKTKSPIILPYHNKQSWTSVPVVKAEKQKKGHCSKWHHSADFCHPQLRANFLWIHTVTGIKQSQRSSVPSSYTNM